MEKFIPIVGSISKDWAINFRKIEKRFMTIESEGIDDVKAIMHEITKHTKIIGGNPYFLQDFNEIQFNYSVLLRFLGAICVF